MTKMRKATKQILSKYLPKSRYASVTYVCPICGKEHEKRVEFGIEWRGNDGYGFWTCTMQPFESLCYECIFSEDPATVEKRKAFYKQIDKELSDAKYGKLLTVMR